MFFNWIYLNFVFLCSLLCCLDPANRFAQLEAPGERQRPETTFRKNILGTRRVLVPEKRLGKFDLNHFKFSSAGYGNLTEFQRTSSLLALPNLDLLCLLLLDLRSQLLSL